MRYRDVQTVLIVFAAMGFVAMLVVMAACGVTPATLGGFLLAVGIMVTTAIASSHLQEFVCEDPDVERLGRKLMDVTPALLLMCERLPKRRFELEVKQDEIYERRDWQTGLVTQPRRIRRNIRVYTYGGSYRFVEEVRALFDCPIIRIRPKSGDTWITYKGILPGEVDIEIMGISDDPYCEVVNVKTELSDEEYDEAVEAELESIRRNPEAHISVQRTTYKTYIRCVE